MSAEGVLLSWHGEELRLRGDGSVHWPARDALLVADVHLGKGAVFRARGIPVPTGDSRADLARLDRALDTTGAGRLVVLGDLFHGRESRAPHVEEALAEWRARRPELDTVLVKGNHDRHAGAPDRALGVRLVEEPWPLGPFVLRHHPPEEEGRAAAPPALAGHLHPVARLRGPGGDRARPPCFWVRPSLLVLPAWGRFTGGYAVPVAPGDRIFVPVEGSVVEVEAGRGPAGADGDPPAG